MNFLRRLFAGEMNKALVPIGMVAIYLVNKHYGVDLPLNADDVLAILGLIGSLVAYHVPNTKV